MNNKLIIGIVVVLLGLGAGWYFLRGTAGSTAGQPQNLGTATGSNPVEAANSGSSGSAQPVATSSVSYTDNGFNPASIIVKVGTTVRFTNNSGSAMWVASNPHPTHTLLPGFDELQSVEKGGSYNYTFVKVGTWTYHNHLNPADQGTVVVTP